LPKDEKRLAARIGGGRESGGQFVSQDVDNTSRRSESFAAFLT
jgi:hypothetical protein